MTSLDPAASARIIKRQTNEIERLRKLVLIGDVRCDRCADAATTLDTGGFASCVDCATQDKEGD